MEAEWWQIAGSVAILFVGNWIALWAGNVLGYNAALKRFTLPEKPAPLTDLRYAIRQLRDFRDVRRALDALERIEEMLASEVES